MAYSQFTVSAPPVQNDSRALWYSSMQYAVLHLRYSYMGINEIAKLEYRQSSYAYSTSRTYEVVPITDGTGY